MDLQADVPAQRLSPHRSEFRKVKVFCAGVLDMKARTSMTRGGLRKKLYAGKYRADFSFSKRASADAQRERERERESKSLEIICVQKGLSPEFRAT